jgi:hypothetical protein
MRVNVLRINVLGCLAVAALTAVFCSTAIAQDQPDFPQDAPGAGRGMGRAFNGVGGQITSIEGSNLTLQTFRGDSAKVKVTSSTRVMKDRVPAKLSDFKVGDRVFVSGEQDKAGVWNAQILAQRTGSGGARGGMQFKPEDNGKTYIAGELIKIEGTKLTVKKLDNTEQIIEVDDDTSFRNQQRESVTLADIKVGEIVRGMGVVKDGVFVPKELNAGRPRGPRPGTPPPPDAAAPHQPPTNPDAAGEKK